MSRCGSASKGSKKEFKRKMYRGRKPSCWALDLGVPMEKVAGIDRRRWWVQVDNMEVGRWGYAFTNPKTRN